MKIAGQSFGNSVDTWKTVQGAASSYLRGPIGFSFLLAWLYLSFYSCTLRPVLINARTMEKFWGIMAAAAAVTVVVVMLWQRRTGGKLNAQAVYLAALACGIGTVLLYVSNVEGINETGFTIIGPALSGIGFALLGFTWKRALGTLEAGMIEVSIPLSVFCAVPIYFVLFTIKGMFAMIAIALLPLASAAFACKLLTAHERNKSNANEEVPSNPAPCSQTDENTQSRLIAPAATLFVIWLNIGFFRAIWSPIFVSDRFTYYLSPFIMAALLSLVVFVIIVLFGKSIRYETHQQVCRWVLPFACLSYALLCVSGNAFVEAAYTANFTGIIITQLYFWTASAKRCRIEGDVRSTKAFGVMFAALLFGGVCGVSIGLFVLPLINLDEVYKFVPLIITALITVMLLLGALSDRKTEKAPIPSADFGEVIDAQVQDMHERFAFTPREQEVLGMLLMGRSRPFIRDELGISLSTVNSHVKNIYEKADVHSYQELLDEAHHESESLSISAGKADRAPFRLPATPQTVPQSSRAR